MPPVGFEITISAGERPRTYALDRAATGTGDKAYSCRKTKVGSFTLSSRCVTLNMKNNHLSRTQLLSCVISGLSREVAENCALLRYYAAIVIISYRCFGTTCQFRLKGQESKRTLQMRPKRCPKTSVRYYLYSLRNILEQRSSRMFSLLK